MLPREALPPKLSPRIIQQRHGFKRVRISLTGLSPLLMNAMTMDVLLSMAEPKKGNAAKTVLTPREQVDRKLHRDQDGHAIIPVGMLFACLRNAGRHVKLDGKRQVSTADSTKLPLLLDLEDAAFRILDTDTGEPSPWEVDIQRGVNPNGGQAVVVVRPRFDAWTIHVTAVINLNEVTEAVIRQLFDIAGRGVGLGDFRPSRGGMFGRFDISCWKDMTPT